MEEKMLITMMFLSKSKSNISATFFDMYLTLNDKVLQCDLHESKFKSSLDKPLVLSNYFLLEKLLFFSL